MSRQRRSVTVMRCIRLLLLTVTDTRLPSPVREAAGESFGEPALYVNKYFAISIY